MLHPSLSLSLSSPSLSLTPPLQNCFDKLLPAIESWESAPIPACAALLACSYIAFNLEAACLAIADAGLVCVMTKTIVSNGAEELRSNAMLLLSSLLHVSDQAFNDNAATVRSRWIANAMALGIVPTLIVFARSAKL